MYSWSVNQSTDLPLPVVGNILSLIASGLLFHKPAITQGHKYLNNLNLI